MSASFRRTLEGGGLAVPGRESGDLSQAAALERLDGNAELLGEMAELFLQQYPKLLDELRGALASRDSKRLGRSAHTLKGSLGNFTSGAAFKSAERLEKLGRDRDFASAEEALNNLAEEIERLRPGLSSLVKEVVN